MGFFCLINMQICPNPRVINKYGGSAVISSNHLGLIKYLHLFARGLWSTPQAVFSTLRLILFCFTYILMAKHVSTSPPQIKIIGAYCMYTRLLLVLKSIGDFIFNLMREILATVFFIIKSRQPQGVWLSAEIAMDSLMLMTPVLYYAARSTVCRTGTFKHSSCVNKPHHVWLAAHQQSPCLCTSITL